MKNCCINLNVFLYAPHHSYKKKKFFSQQRKLSIKRGVYSFNFGMLLYSNVNS